MLRLFRLWSNTLDAPEGSADDGKRTSVPGRLWFKAKRPKEMVNCARRETWSGLEPERTLFGLADL